MRTKKEIDHRIGASWRDSQENDQAFSDLDVYQNALETGLRAYELSKKFPDSERYAVNDQIRQFVALLFAQTLRRHGASDGSTAGIHFQTSAIRNEAAETQVHMEFAFRHGYIGNAEFQAIDDAYEHILGQLVRMIDHPEKWVIGGRMNT